MFRFVLLVWLPLASCALAEAGAPLHAERITAAQTTYEANLALHAAGSARLEDVCAWSVRWHRAQQDAGDAAAGEAHLARMEALAAQVNQAVTAGMASASDAAAMRYFLAEAKVWAAK